MNSLAELRQKGFCVLRGHFPAVLIERCRAAFWPVLLDYLDRNRDKPNRGPCRHFLPMSFDPPCFAPEFFFDPAVLSIVRGAMDDRIVADQWGCDVPLLGSQHQNAHIDYQRPLFPEAPDLPLPPYMLVVSFGLVPIRLENGPIEIAHGTGPMRPVPLEIGDVLIRHPWALHRGTPNTTATPRALVTIRYVRRWYADASREVCAMPAEVWRSLSPEQQALLRFPVTEPGT